MNETNRAVTEADLHAYADGQLPEAARAHVEAYLAENPEEAAMVAAWQTQNAGIKSLFAGYEKSRDADHRMVTLVVQPASPWKIRSAFAAAAVILLALGAVSDRFIPPLFERPPLQLAESETLPKQAETAFLVYASEVRHPVEVFANEEAHLATWLGKRLAIPDLKIGRAHV